MKILSYIWQKMPDEAVKYPNMVDYRKRMDGKRKGSLGVAGYLWRRMEKTIKYYRKYKKHGNNW